MKKYLSNYFLMALALCFLFACKKDDNKGPGIWNTNPLEEYSATPINGGAIINYTIPDNPELLYLMAKYERNGKIFTEKASVYNNTLTIQGFDTEDKVKVKLYKVNRQGQESEASELEFTPLEVGS